MNLLIQFLLRLTFGLTAGMGITSSHLVTSGYFRNHLYVTLGLSSLAAMLCRAVRPEAFWYAVAAAALSYIGSVCWLYEKPLAGKIMLFTVAIAALSGSFLQSSTAPELTAGAGEQQLRQNYLTQTGAGEVLNATEAEKLGQRAQWLSTSTDYLKNAANISSGLLLGITMASMLLGHWYLNSPTMELLPLRRLILAMGIALLLQLVVSVCGLWGELAHVEQVSTQWTLFVLLRWTFGLVGVGAMAWMAWQTLKIPNTQSATGILYVAVIGTFVGETMALLLSTESLFPL